MNEVLFRVEALEVRYGDVTALAVDGLEIRAGERVALVGPNGAGKTTFLKALDGLATPSAGRIVRAHVEPVAPRAGSTESRGGSAANGSRAMSVYLHEAPYILSGSVEYNVEFGCRARGMGRDESRRRASGALALVGLEGFGVRRHRALSGGEAQRVALARAMATGAEALLLDEPTSRSSQAASGMIVRALLAAAAGGATLVFSTHDRGFARSLANRVLEFEGGRIIRDERIVDGVDHDSP